MKKIFSALLALILLFSLCVAVFADEPESLEEYEADVSQLYNVETAADDSDFVKTIDETETGDSVQNEVIEVTTDGDPIQDEVIEVTTDEDSIQDEVTDVTAADDSIQTETANETAADSSDGAEIAEEADPDSEATPSVDLIDEPTFNVTIEWSGMNFTYVDGDKGEWDPETGAYSNGQSKGNWKSDSGTDGCGKITITNKSATGKAIDATIKFDEDDRCKNMAAVKISSNKPTDWTEVEEKYFSGTSKGYTNGLSSIGGTDNVNARSVYIMPVLAPGADYSKILSSLPQSQDDSSYGALGNITITISDAVPWSSPSLPEPPGTE